MEDMLHYKTTHKNPNYDGEMIITKPGWITGISPGIVLVSSTSLYSLLLSATYGGGQMCLPIIGVYYRMLD